MGLSTFPPRNLSSDVSLRDPCATRLPALANSTLAALIRCGTGGMDAELFAASIPGTIVGAPPVPGAHGIPVVLKPLADCLSLHDALHWRRALVAAASAKASSECAIQIQSCTGVDNGAESAVERQRAGAAEHERQAVETREDARAAALDLLVAAINAQPALMVLLFWARPPITPGGEWQDLVGAGSSAGAASASSTSCAFGSNTLGSAESGDVTLSTAVLSVLSALWVEGRSGESRTLVGSEEALSRGLYLVLALWQAEGVGRLGQVF